MPETSITDRQPLPSKTSILVASLVDFAIDLFLPTAIFALLSPTGLSPAVRLTVGGFFVAAKVSAGRVASPDKPEARTSFFHSFGVGVMIAALCSALTIAVAHTGRSDTMAISLGTGILVAAEGARVVRRWRHLDGFAILVLIELTATIILTSVNNSARFILIRPSFYTAIAAIYVLTTVWTPRPFMMQVSKPMAAGGDPVRAEAFERAGCESLRFRRMEQAMTIGLAVVLFAEAVLRVVTVFSRPANDVLRSSLWSQAPAIGLFVVYFAVLKVVFIPRASQEVDALMPTNSTLR
jgi:hypothetical protein